jgi:uncharacterized protein YaaQ
MTKECKICSKKFYFSEEEFILANGESFLEKGHHTALFGDCCQRCNAILTHLDAPCACSDTEEATRIINEFADSYSNSPMETLNFIAYVERNFENQ